MYTSTDYTVRLSSAGQYQGKHRKPCVPTWPNTLLQADFLHDDSRCCCPWRDDPDAGSKAWGWAGYCPVHSVRCNW